MSAMRVRPSSSTMPWSETSSARLAFCSIISTVMPRARISAQDREQLVDHDRREADRGLVDQHQLRLEQQRAGDLQHLLLAAGERRGLRARPCGAAPGSGPSRRQCAPRGRSRGRRHHGAELEIVPHRQLGEDVAALRHVGDAAPDQRARRQVGDVGAVEADAARARRQHAEHGLEHGRLAGAVRADHRGDGAARAPTGWCRAGSSSCRSRRRRPAARGSGQWPR